MGGGGKKRGVENLTNDTPPTKGFWTPPCTARFPPPSCVNALFFLHKNPRQSRPEALLEGSKNFRESAFSGMFSSPHTFCTPPISRPNSERERTSPSLDLQQLDAHLLQNRRSKEQHEPGRSHAGQFRLCLSVSAPQRGQRKGAKLTSA